ncbi:MAG: hypothetical protein H6861_06360 [Rhodospirillales bacterium]|nr:hypothetical protein [Rhodospirillales bacterium]
MFSGYFNRFSRRRRQIIVTNDVGDLRYLKKGVMAVHVKRETPEVFQRIDEVGFSSIQNDMYEACVLSDVLYSKWLADQDSENRPLFDTVRQYENSIVSLFQKVTDIKPFSCLLHRQVDGRRYGGDPHFHRDYLKYTVVSGVYGGGLEYKDTQGESVIADAHDIVAFPGTNGSGLWSRARKNCLNHRSSDTDRFVFAIGYR